MCLADFESGCGAMGFKTNPTARRRLDPDEQRRRDAEIWRLYREGVSQRNIARSLGVSLGTVQHVIRREKRARKPLGQSVDSELGVLAGELPADVDLSDPGNIAVLRDLAREPDNPLYRYRLRHLRRLPDTEDW
jgi:Helix-turn-helix domain